jgi:hypothetical protein
MRPEFIAAIRANKHLSSKDLRVGKKGNAICFCHHRKYCHCQGFDRSEQIVPPFSPLLPQRAVGQTMSWVGTPEARFRRRRWRRWPQRQHRRPVPLRRRSVLRPAVPLATVVLLRGPAIAFSRKAPAVVASVVAALVGSPVVVAIIVDVMLPENRATPIITLPCAFAVCYSP